MDNQRIKAIYEASILLFLQQGYAKTQISHIAKAVGVSVGTIYHDFNGKQEIMHFLLKCTIDPDFLERTFRKPITDDLFENLESEIIATFEGTLGELSLNLQRLEDYCFEALVSDTFDLLARYAVGCLFIEKNQSEVPKLADYYRGYRGQFFEILARYMRGFMERGVVRPLEHVELSTTLIVEILSWWAMDMRYVSFQTCDVPMELARRVCLDNIVTAYKN